MISSDSWKEIEERLKKPDAHVIFGYKEHTIVVRRLAISESRLALVVFLDGRVDLQWWNVEDQGIKALIEKFWCRVETKVFSAAARRDLKARFGDQAAEKSFDFGATSTTWLPRFLSTRTLVQKYRSIDDLVLIDADTTEAALAA